MNEAPPNARLLANYIVYCHTIARVLEQQDYYIVSISDPEVGNLAVSISGKEMARFLREQAVRRLDDEFIDLQNKLDEATKMVDQYIANARDKVKGG
jgi:hypothetical protein